jgi:hypothetical protein
MATASISTMICHALMELVVNAVEAAVCVAERFGLSVEEPVLLRSTNNVVAWLRPLMIVAKIGVGQQRGFQTEVSVASELGALGGPIVPPMPEFPAVVHSQGGFDVTFWRYYPQPPDVDIPGEQVAAALQCLHATCAKISTELRAALPSYLGELQSVSELLLDDRRLSALLEVDRHLLIRAFDQLWKRVQVASIVHTHVVIHGSPHPSNVLLVDGTPRFIDFEMTSIGPIEWDLAHTSPDTVHNYTSAIDTELLQTCRELVRVKTAAWCWADVHRGDLRYHAEMHLAHLKKTFAALIPV